jgi:hypothetical protein
MNKIFILTIFFSKFTLSFGQAVDTNGLFSRGIYLENSNVTIPWKINYSKINIYDNPKVSISPKHYKNWVLIKWDSVKIVGGIDINLYCLVPKKIFFKTGNLRMPVIKGNTDSTNLNKLRIFFTTYAHDPGSAIKTRKSNYNFWMINGFSITLGYFKKLGYYFQIIKESPLVD